MNFLPVVRATACVALALALPAATAAPPIAVSYGKLGFTPCTLSQPGQAQTVPARCAVLEVPENRSSPNGRRIELGIASGEP